MVLLPALFADHRPPAPWQSPRLFVYLSTYFKLFQSSAFIYSLSYWYCRKSCSQPSSSSNVSLPPLLKCPQSNLQVTPNRLLSICESSVSTESNWSHSAGVGIWSHNIRTTVRPEVFRGKTTILFFSHNLPRESSLKNVFITNRKTGEWINISSFPELKHGLNYSCCKPTILYIL